MIHVIQTPPQHPLQGAMEGKSADDGLFQRVQEYCMSQGFESDFEAFAADHQELFEEAAEEKSEEHKLEYYDVYQKYLSRYEGKIAEFIESQGSTIQEFQAQCREALQSSGEWSGRRFFIEALLATTEYGVFLSLMKQEAKKNALDRHRK